MSSKLRTVEISKITRPVIFLLLLAGIVMVIKNWELIHPVAVQQWIEGVGPLAPLLFMLLFALSAVLFIPATVMVLAGGALFGPWMGAFYNITGATLGAILAFLISRYLARDWAEHRAGSKLRVIMLGVKEEGWKFVLLIRLAGFPYFILNYILGLTPLRLGPYAIASYLGLAPSTAAVTYAGHVGFEAVSGGEDITGKIVTAIALIGAVALIPVVIRIVKKRKTRPPEPPA